MRAVLVKLETAGPLMVTAPASNCVNMPPAVGAGVVLLPVIVAWTTVQLPIVVVVTELDPPVATDGSSKPVICVNSPEMEASVNAPLPEIDSPNCDMEKPPTVIVPPLSRDDSCELVYPCRTQAAAEALGAIESVVAELVVLPSTICKTTVHPVGTLAGKVTLI